MSMQMSPVSYDHTPMLPYMVGAAVRGSSMLWSAPAVLAEVMSSKVGPYVQAAADLVYKAAVDRV